MPPCLKQQEVTSPERLALNIKCDNFVWVYERLSGSGLGEAQAEESTGCTLAVSLHLRSQKKKIKRPCRVSGPLSLNLNIAQSQKMDDVTIKVRKNKGYPSREDHGKKWSKGFFWIRFGSFNSDVLQIQFFKTEVQ